MLVIGPVFAEGGHTSCKVFDNDTAGFAKSEQPFGQVVRQLAPADAGFHDTQVAVCEPKS